MKSYIRFDWVIKYMLRDKANYVIVEGFLSELLGQTLYIKELLESESNKDSFEDKFNRVDLLVKTQRGELIIIELQYETELDYFHRILYGTSKLITQYLSEGDPYSRLKKVISVSMVYFDLGIGTDYLYHGTTSFRGIRCQDQLQLNSKQQQLYHCQQIIDLYPEYYLIKVNQFPDIITDTLDQWIYFLKNEQILENFTAQGLKEAQEKLEVVKLPDEKRQAYETYLENRRYQNSMMESSRLEGFLEGEQTKTLKIAKKLLTSLDDTSISEVTGLDIATVQQLRETRFGK